jgi:NADH-quinone oxidoreductase subunit L
MNIGLMTLSGLIALAGIGLAYQMYRRQPDLPGRLARAVPGLYQLSLNKFYIDELYAMYIVGPLDRLAKILGGLDKQVIDNLVDLTGQAPRVLGYLFRPVQNGLVQFYALAMLLGLTVFILALVRAL